MTRLQLIAMEVKQSLTLSKVHTRGIFYLRPIMETTFKVSI
uniref:Uncharacterized protein n=1 Tax=Rhizophora mucronata TaxID=61149 RepID=A0A2P2NL83_RHIMU